MHLQVCDTRCSDGCLSTNGSRHILWSTSQQEEKLFSLAPPNRIRSGNLLRERGALDSLAERGSVNVQLGHWAVRRRRIDDSRSCFLVTAIQVHQEPEQRVLCIRYLPRGRFDTKRRLLPVLRSVPRGTFQANRCTSRIREHHALCFEYRRGTPLRQNRRVDGSVGANHKVKLIRFIRREELLFRGTLNNQLLHSSQYNEPPHQKVGRLVIYYI